MNSDEEYPLDGVDSSNESSGDNVEHTMEVESTASLEKQNDIDDPYEVLSTEQIVQQMVDSIKDEVSSVIQLPHPTVRILLNHFKWDKEKLMDQYYNGDQEQLYMEAGVVNPAYCKPVNPSKKISTGTEDCEICYMNLPSAMMTGLECNHRFCTQCWTKYLTTKIMEEGLGQNISCAGHACDILVDDAIVMSLIKDSKVRLKYQRIITNSFVQCNRLFRWCPLPDCNNVIRVQNIDHRRPVTCRCLHTFCFKCGENWHNPIQCYLLKKWIKKCEDDLETSNWLAANTKDCPKCKVTIEKNGGCNHMVCRNQNCKAEFCWVCLGSWESHKSSYFKCNQYDDEESAAAYDAQECSRSALTRYLFYCNRYMNHMQSLKFEHKLYASVEEKIEQIMQCCHNSSWIEVQFLKKAVDILCQCRQTLMYTYVFAFYLKKNNQSIIFEDNQHNLENTTETLSEYLEHEITSENLADIKQQIQDQYSMYCDRRRKLLKHVGEGYDNDWWMYTLNRGIWKKSRILIMGAYFTICDLP